MTKAVNKLMAAGYSANPLYKKLGLKEGFSVKLIDPPDNYMALIGEFSGKLVFKNAAATDLQFIHFFTNSVKELETALPLLKQQITTDGMIWVSWYKKSCGKTTELSDNIIRE